MIIQNGIYWKIMILMLAHYVLEYLLENDKGHFSRSFASSRRFCRHGNNTTEYINGLFSNLIFMELLIHHLNCFVTIPLHTSILFDKDMRNHTRILSHNLV